MPPSALRDRKRERTRRALQRAAVEMFESRGYEATTVADIAAAAEVGTRTFFNYFASKEELLFPEPDERVTAAAHAIATRHADERPVEVLLRALRAAGDNPGDQLGDDLGARIAVLRAQISRTVPAVSGRAAHAQLAAQMEIAHHLRAAFPDELDEVEAAALVGAVVGAVSGALTALFAQPRGIEDSDRLHRQIGEITNKVLAPWLNPAPGQTIGDPARPDTGSVATPTRSAPTPESEGIRPDSADDPSPRFRSTGNEPAPQQHNPPVSAGGDAREDSADNQGRSRADTRVDAESSVPLHPLDDEVGPHAFASGLTGVREAALRLDFEEPESPAPQSEDPQPADIRRAGEDDDIVASVGKPEIQVSEDTGKAGSEDGVRTGATPRLVHSASAPSNAVGPADATSKVVRLADATANVVRPGDASSNVVRPTDATANVVRPGDASSNVVRPADVTSNVVRSGDVTSNVVRPGDAPSNVVRPEDASSNVVRAGEVPSNVVRLPGVSATVAWAGEPERTSPSAAARLHDLAAAVRGVRGDSVSGQWAREGGARDGQGESASVNPGRGEGNPAEGGADRPAADGWAAQQPAPVRTETGEFVVREHPAPRPPRPAVMVPPWRSRMHVNSAVFRPISEASAQLEYADAGKLYKEAVRTLRAGNAFGENAIDHAETAAVDAGIGVDAAESASVPDGNGPELGGSTPTAGESVDAGTALGESGSEAENEVLV
nr:TetR family transcriptional regulator [Nocardia inohanensis]